MTVEKFIAHVIWVVITLWLCGSIVFVGIGPFQEGSIGRRIVAFISAGCLLVLSVSWMLYLDGVI